MIEYLSKRKFINALAREVAIESERENISSASRRGIHLELMWPTKDRSTLTFVIRGNQFPQTWMVYESGFSADEKGYLLAFKTAADFAFEACRTAYKKTGRCASVGLPEVTYGEGMNQLFS